MAFIETKLCDEKNNRVAVIVGMGSTFTFELAKNLIKCSTIYLLGTKTEKIFMNRKLVFFGEPFGEQIQVKSINSLAIQPFVRSIVCSPDKFVDIFIDTAAFFRISESLRFQYYDMIDQFIVSQGGKRLILISPMYGNECAVQTNCLIHRYKGKIPLQIYKTPLLTHKPLRGNVELAYHLYFYMKKFKNWIEERWKGYFKNTDLHICIGKDQIVSLMSQKDVVSKLCTCMDQFDAPEVYITNPIRISCLQFIQQLGKILDITIQNVEDDCELNEVDTLFSNVLKQFLPEITDGTHMMSGQEKSDLEKLQTYMDSSFLGPHKFFYDSPQAFTGNTSKKICVFPDGIEHVYYLYGKGEPIIIVNALGATVGAWKSFINELAKLYSVYIWETRGVFIDSDSAFQIENYDLEAQTKEIKWIADSEGLDSFHILAWCSGVKSAFQFANAYPEKVRSLIILAGDFLPFEGYRGRRAKFLDDLEVIKDLVTNKNKMLKYYLQLIYQGNFNKEENDSDNAPHKKILEIMPGPYRNFFFSQFSDLNQSINFFKICIDYYEHDTSALIQETEKPVLLIAAEEDIVSPPEQSAFVAQHLRNGSLHVLPATTHVMMLERVDEIIDLIEHHMLALEGDIEKSAILQEE